MGWLGLFFPYPRPNSSNLRLFWTSLGWAFKTKQKKIGEVRHNRHLIIPLQTRNHLNLHQLATKTSCHPHFPTLLKIKISKSQLTITREVFTPFIKVTARNIHYQRNKRELLPNCLKNYIQLLMLNTSVRRVTISTNFCVLASS